MREKSRKGVGYEKQKYFEKRISLLIVLSQLHSAIKKPLLFTSRLSRRSFRSVGDEMFMEAFEQRTLPFEQWTHEAHLRMAWNYIKEYGPEHAALKIKYKSHPPYAVMGI